MIPRTTAAPLLLIRYIEHPTAGKIMPRHEASDQYGDDNKPPESIERGVGTEEIYFHVYSVLNFMIHTWNKGC